MTSPGGREVGRVSVRVVPDTSGFRRELERELDTIERSLRIEIPTSLDTSGLDAEARRAKDQVGRTPARITVDPVTAGFERQVRAEVTKVTRAVNADIPLTARGEQLRQEVASQVHEIERSLRAEIPVDPEGAAEFRRKLAAQVKAASATVKAEVNVDVDQGAISRVTSALGSLIGLGGQAGQTFGSLAGSAANAGSSLGTAATSTASAGIAMAAAIPLAAALAAGVGLLAGAVLAVGGAAGAALSGLPVLLTGLVAPAAAVYLGFDGIKRAAETLRPEVDALKASLSSTFEGLARPIFEQLRVVFPVLERGLTGVAVATAGFAGQLVNVVTSGPGLAAIERALNGVSLMLAAATPGAAALLTQLLNIAGTTPLYHILGETIGGLTQRFADFLARIQDASQGPSLLTRSLEQLRGVLFSVADAFLALLTGAMEFFTAAGPGIQGFFDGLTAAFSSIDWAALGASFGQIFQAIGDGLAAVPPETWQLLAQAVQFFADAVTQFVESGALNLLVLGFAALVAGAGGLVDEFTTLLIPFTLLGQALGLVSTQATTTQGSMDGLNAKTTETSGAFAGMGASVSASVGSMFSAVIGWFQQLPGQLGYLAGYAAGTVIHWFAELPRQVTAAVGAMVTSVVGFFQQLPGRLGGLASSAVSSVVGFFQQLPARIMGFVGQMFEVGAALVRGLINGIISMAARAIAAAAELVAGAIRGARAAAGAHSPSTVFRGIGADIGRGLELGVLSTREQVVAAIRSIVERIAALVPNLADQWYTAGRDIASELARGLHAEDARLARATAGLIQAEDGSWVPPSFYAGGQSQSSDLARQLDGVEVVIDSRGSDLIARWVNRSNALAAAR